MDIQSHKVKIEELRRRFLQEAHADNADVIYLELEREAAAKLVKLLADLMGKHLQVLFNPCYFTVEINL